MGNSRRLWTLITAGLISAVLVGRHLEARSATQVAFATQPPTTLATAANFANFQAVVEDASGAAVTSGSPEVRITFQRASDGQIVSGQSGFASNGIVTFFPLIAAPGTYLVTLSSDGLASASATIAVTGDGGTFGSASVGQSQPRIGVQLDFSASASVSQVRVLTGGLPNLDFTQATDDPGTCAAQNYSAGDSCTVNVVFAPTAAGLRHGAVVLSDGSGHGIATALISGTGRAAVAQYGSGVSSYVQPIDTQWTGSIAVDEAGDVFVGRNHGVFKYPADNSGPVQVATYLGTVDQIAFDGAGFVYYGIGGGVHVARADAVGVDLNADAYYGNPDLASHPSQMAINTNGDVYLANNGAGDILVLPRVNGTLQTAQEYTVPVLAYGLAFDSMGNLFTTSAGDGTVTETPVENGVLNFSHRHIVLSNVWNVGAIFFDAGDNMYFGVYNAGISRVPATSHGYDAAGAVTIAASAQLVSQMAFGKDTRVYFADGGFQHWGSFALDFGPQPLHFTGTVGSTSATQTEPVFNAGNAALIFQSLTLPSGFVPGVTPNGCAAGNLLATGRSCDLSIAFQPTSVGVSTGTAFILDDSSNLPNPQTIALDGTAANEIPLMSVLPSPANPVYGQSVAVVVNATSIVGNQHPGGQYVVTLDPDTTNQAFTAAVNVNGPTSVSLGMLPVGSHTVSAVYQPDANSSYATVTSSTTFSVGKANVQAQVNPPPSVTYGQSQTAIVTFQTGPGMTPPTGGMITYHVDTNPDQTAGITQNPTVAQLPLGVLSVVNGGAGSHSVTISYSGDANYNGGGLPGTSATVTKANVNLQIAATSPTYPNHSTITVTVSGPGSGSVAPSAGLTYVIDGTSHGSAALSSISSTASQAVIDAGPLNGGGHTVSVTYPGDNTFNSASNGTGFSVQAATQTVTIAQPANGSSFLQSASPIPLQATATSGLTNFVWTVVSGPASVSGNSLVLNGTGSVNVLALQPGNSSFSAANATSTFTVTSSGGGGGGGGSSSVLFPATSVGSFSSGQLVTFTFSSASSIGSALVVTGGVQNQDFTKAPSGSNCVGSHAGGSTCVVNVVFAPKAPGMRRGAVVLYDQSTNKPVQTVLLAGVGLGAGVAFGNPTLATQTTVAGAPGIAVDATGVTRYVAAGSNVVKVTGNAQTPFMSGLGSASGLTIDGSGALFVTDAVNGLVQRIPNENGTLVLADARQLPGLGAPVAVVTDPAGNMYVSDTSAGRIVLVAAGAIAPTTFLSGLSDPRGLAFDAHGNLFVADAGANTVYEVPSLAGVLTPAAKSTVWTCAACAPTGVVTDAAGDVYVGTATQLVELPNESGALNPAHATALMSATGPNAFAGLAIDGSGSLSIARGDSGAIQMLALGTPAVTNFGIVAIGQTSAPLSVTVQNIGNQQLIFSQIGFPSQFPPAPSSCGFGSGPAPGLTCAISLSFRPTAIGQQNGLVNLADNAANIAGSQVVPFIGTGGTSAVSTQTMLAFVLNGPTIPGTGGIPFGTTETATATVTASDGTTPTGSVSFVLTTTWYDDPFDGIGPHQFTTQLGSQPLVNGMAAVTFVPQAEHDDLQATYAPVSPYAVSTTTVAAAGGVQHANTRVPVTSNSRVATYGTAPTLAVTVSAVPGTPAGAGVPKGFVRFVDLGPTTDVSTSAKVNLLAVGPNDTLLGTVFLDANGRAQMPTVTNLAIGTHRIWVHYVSRNTDDESGVQSNNFGESGAFTTIDIAPPFLGNPLTSPVTGLCTVPVMNESLGLPIEQPGTQAWYVQADGSGSIDVTAFARALDPQHEGAATLSMIVTDTVTQTSIEAPKISYPNGGVSNPGNESSADLLLPNTVPGRIYQVTVSTKDASPGNPIARVYRLHLRGATAVGLGDPSSLLPATTDPQSDANITDWSFNVADPSVEPTISVSIIPGPGTAATSATTAAFVELLDGRGIAQWAGGVTLSGSGATISAPATFAGVWTLRITRIDGSYRVHKLSGPDTGVYMVDPTSTCGAIETLASVTFDTTDALQPSAATSVDATTVGAAPAGYRLTSHAWDVITATSFTDTATVCFAAPWARPEDTAGLRLLHNEGGTLVDRTVLAPDPSGPNADLRTLCARIPASSVVAQQFGQDLGAFVITTISSPGIGTHANVSAEATSPAGAVVTFTPPTVSDAVDGGGSATCAPASGSMFPMGHTTVTCTFTDSARQTASSAFTVTVVDTTPPGITIAAPANGAVYSTGQVVSVSYACVDAATGVASCTGPLVNGAAVDTTSAGSHTFTVTATDAAGNPSTSTATYTIAPPGRMHGSGYLAGPPGDSTMQQRFTFDVTQVPTGQSGGRFSFWTTDSAAKPRIANTLDSSTITSIVFSDDPGFAPGSTNPPAVDTVTMSGAGQWNGVDGYSFQAVATDQGLPGVGKDTLSLTVFDPDGSVVYSVTGVTASGEISSMRLPGRNAPPLIINAAPTQVGIETTSPAGAVATWAPAFAVDSTGATIPVTCSPASGSTFVLGTTHGACTATDSRNTTTTVTFSVSVVDTTAPVFSAQPQDLWIEATAPNGAAVTFDLPAATDIGDASPTVKCSPASGATIHLGQTTVTCKATDHSGNSSSVTFNVTVQDTTPPVFTSQPPNLIVEATSAAGARVTYAKPKAIDTADNSVSVTCGLSAPPVVFFALAAGVNTTPAGASGSTFGFGDTTVQCTATDNSGNTATTQFTVTVVDRTAPTISAHGDVSVQATGPDGAVVSYTSPATHDAVDGAGTASCAPASGSTFPIGPTTVTCSATDNAGNSSSSSFTVTVKDTVVPTITVAAPKGSYALHAVATASYACADTGSGIASCVGTLANGAAIDTSTPGTFTFTVTATDNAGNVATKTVSYTVKNK